MKLYYFLEKGDIIQEGDEAYYYGSWVKSRFIGQPVVAGMLRRPTLFLTPEDSICNSCTLCGNVCEVPKCAIVASCRLYPGNQEKA